MSNGRNRGTGYSRVRMPNADRPPIGRAVFTLILSLLLPPLGLMFMWRMAVFQQRGRILISVLSTVEMMLFIFLMLPGVVLETAMPIPSTPQAVSFAPESNVRSALSNMDEILYQKELDEMLAQGGDANALLPDEEQLQLAAAEQEAILGTTVYSVYSGARFYHSSQVCGNQSNRRALTVREAMAEGLGACPDCNPPVYGFTTE